MITGQILRLRQSRGGSPDAYDAYDAYAGTAIRGIHGLIHSTAPTIPNGIARYPSMASPAGLPAEWVAG
jgi:hypothetical protein